MNFKILSLAILITFVSVDLMACKNSKKDNSSDSNTENLEQAQKEIEKADQLYLRYEQAYNDSCAANSATIADATALQDSALTIYENIAKKYDNSVGNKAKLMAGEIYYNKGKYTEALKYLEDYSPDGTVIGSSSQILLGDTYVNLGKYDEGIKAYDKAIDLAKDNKAIIPYAMQKKAIVLDAQGKYDEEIEIYEEIENKYLGSGSMSNKIELAKAKAGY